MHKLDVDSQKDLAKCELLPQHLSDEMLTKIPEGVKEHWKAPKSSILTSCQKTLGHMMKIKRESIDLSIANKRPSVLGKMTPPPLPRNVFIERPNQRSNRGSIT